MSGRRERIAFAAGLAIVCAISGWLAWRLDAAPDESSHLTMVEHHAHHLDLVTSDEMQYGDERGHAYFLFSPLPYYAYVPFQWAQEHLPTIHSAARPDRFYTRLGGLPIAAAQFALTVALVRRLCRRRDLGVQAVAVALAANLLPQLRYLHAYVHTDGVTVLAATACAFVALRVLQAQRLELSDAALVGAALAFTAHVRYQAFVLGGVALGAFAVRVLRQRASIRSRVRLIGVAVALPVLVAGSFHLGVYDQRENRHVLPTVDVEQLNDSTFAGEILDKPPAKVLIRRRIDQVPGVWMGVWAWYITYVELTGFWLVLLAALCLVGLAGLVLPGGTVLDRPARIIGLAAVGATVVVWIAMASQWLVGQQGKFLLPTGFPALVALIVGTGALLERVRRVREPVLVAAMVWGGLLFGLDVWALYRVAAA